MFQHESKIVDRKIPYSTQWFIFFRACPQWRLSELIAHSVCQPTTTLKGNAPSQTLVWHAILPCYACELTANLVFVSYPFWLQMLASKLHVQLKLCTPQLRERTEENSSLCAVRIQNSITKNIFDQNKITRITPHECCDVISSQKSCDDIASQSQ